LYRYLSSFINKVDRKGRVSVPAGFRTMLQHRSGQTSPVTELYTLQSIHLPTIEAGGTDWLDVYEQKLGELDPLSEEYDDLSFYVHGDSAFLKIDSDGRVMLNDAMRDHADITDEVVFVGRGDHFQLWSPQQFKTYRPSARQRVLSMRRKGKSDPSSNQANPE
jgi:MraZ protein